jgi:hypothetical protein
LWGVAFSYVSGGQGKRKNTDDRAKGRINIR